MIMKEKLLRKAVRSALFGLVVGSFGMAGVIDVSAGMSTEEDYTVAPDQTVYAIYGANVIKNNSNQNLVTFGIAAGIESSSSGFVSSGTLYTELREGISSTNYISASNSTAENLSQLDSILNDVYEHMGEGATYTAGAGITIGSDNSIGIKYLTMNETSIAWGNSTTYGSSHSNELAIGYQASADGFRAVALGTNATVSGGDGVSIGGQSIGDSDTSIGVGSMAGFDVSGLSAKQTVQNATAVGAASGALDNYNTAIGSYAFAGFYTMDGSSMTLSFDEAEYATAVGAQGMARANYSTSLGSNTYAIGANSVAIGYGSSVSTDATTDDVTHTTTRVVSFGHAANDSKMDFSAGAEGTYTDTLLSRLTNVAAGTANTDAATVGQLVDSSAEFAYNSSTKKITAKNKNGDTAFTLNLDGVAGETYTAGTYVTINNGAISVDVLHDVSSVGNDGKIYSAQAVYDEVRGDVGSGYYVSDTYSIGENVKTLDQKLGRLENGNYLSEYYSFADNLRKLDEKIGQGRTGSNYFVQADSDVFTNLTNLDYAIGVVNGKIGTVSSDGVYYINSSNDVASNLVALDGAVHANSSNILTLSSDINNVRGQLVDSSAEFAYNSSTKKITAKNKNGDTAFTLNLDGVAGETYTAGTYVTINNGAISVDVLHDVSSVGNDGKIYSAQAVYDEVRGDVGSGYYVSDTYSIGENVKTLDQKLGRLENGNYLSEYYSFADNLRKLDEKIGQGRTGSNYFVQADSDVFTNLTNLDYAIGVVNGKIGTVSSDGVYYINSSNDVASNLVALDGAVHANSSNILTLSSDMDNVKLDVGTLKSDVGTLQGDMTGVKGDIGTLQNDMTGVKGDIGTLQNDIGTLQSDMTGVKGDIGTLQGDIGTLQSDMTGVKGDIGTLQSDMTGVKGDIGTLQSDMTGVKGDIGTLQSDMTGVKGDIGTLQSDMTGVKGDIGTLQSDMTGVKGDIGTLQSDMTGVKGDIGTLQSDMTGVKGDIGTLQGDMTGVKGDIGTLQGDMNEVKGNVLNNGTQITSLSDRIGTLSDGNYNVIKTNNTVSQNLAALDKAITSTITPDVQNIMDLINSDGAKADGDNAVALGKDSKAEGASSISFGDQAGATGANAVAIGSGAKANADNTVSIGNGYIVKGQDSMAIGQGDGVKTIISGKNSIAIGNGHIISGSNSGAFGDPTYIDADESYAIGNNNTLTGSKTFVLGNNVNTSASNAVILGDGSTATEDNVVSVGSAGNERKITNVAKGTNDTDAVNYAQLKEAMQGSAEGINQVLGSLSNDINKVGAGAAALAALRPEGFDPDDKWSFAVGYGHYKNANAGAFGAFFKPNADTTVSLGSTIGNGNSMMNVGVSFKFGARGKGASIYSSNADLVREVNSLRKINADQAQKIASLEEQVAQILKMVDLSGAVQKTAVAH